MKIRVTISEYYTQYLVSECAYLTNEVLIYKPEAIFLGEVIDEHQRARDLGFSDGEISKIGEGENLQDGEGI